jgi:hypothetical protein
LSVYYQRSRIWVLPDEDGEIIWGDGEYLSNETTFERFPLTFDLATGEELSLADMFTGGAEDLKLLDEILLAKLRAADAEDERDGVQTGHFPQDGASLSLVGSYAPIEADQKFSLMPDGNTELIFDHETPQFDAGHSQTVDIDTRDFRGRMTLFGRFALPPEEGAALYTAEPPLKRQLFSAHSDNAAIYELLPSYREETYAGVRVSFLFETYCNIPAELAEPILRGRAQLGRGKSRGAQPSRFFPGGL